MGLCKCPKRKTTSQFCFQHCVNVCEHCIVNNHTTCVVKSYTTWLKESSGTSTSSSSASALCAVCHKQFVLTQKEMENVFSNSNVSTSNSKTALRLLCYHIVHARCLSVSVKKQLKGGTIVKCPSCAQPFWTQQEEKFQDSNDIIVDEVNELSPVALQLYKYLLNHGDWWGQALISNNGNVKDNEKCLFDNEDLYEESADEESPSTLVQTIQSSNRNTSYYNLNSSNLTRTTPDLTTMNYRNTYQACQPIYNRHFSNNYGIDMGFISHQQQQQHQCSTINMTTIAQSSDLSNRQTITSSTPLLNNDNNLNFDEEKNDLGSKYRPKKVNNQSWFSNYQQLLQYFCGTNNRSEDSTTRIAIIIIFCIFIMVILLVAITNYTRSNNEPFDNNSIDYGGGENQENNGAAHVQNYNINNL